MILQTFAIFLAGLMVGNEFCVSAFVHPQLRALDDRAHAAAAKAIARVLGMVMPLWYAGTLLLAGAVAFSLRHSERGSYELACVSAALFLAAIVYTIAGLVPINTRIAGWDLENLPGDWKRMRLTWDSRHAVRVVLLAVTFACLVTASLTSKG